MKQMSLGPVAVFLAGIACLAGGTMPSAQAQDANIAAVVNGEVITTTDVTNRALLLALSTGMKPTPDILTRLKPQITQQLIDQTLQMQEITKMKVNVPEADIATAIGRIEQGNNLPAGGLKAKMTASGIAFSSLVAQIRTELGWQAVLHKVLGPELQPTKGDIEAEKTALKAEIGTTQYHLSEIFIPVSDPANDATAKNFASTVIAQLRTGAPFPVVAAQFSQAPTALQGGDMGYLPLNELDPGVAAVVTSMPTGAISNPIRVPGGYDIVQMQGTHVVGSTMQTTLSMRQVFVPYPTPITNGQVGPEQAAVITKLVNAAKNVHSCPDMETLNVTFGKVHPADPGPVDLASVTPPNFQQMLASIPENKVSPPLVAQDGVTVVMVCSRETKAAALPSDEQIANVIIDRRVQMESQQLLDGLKHESVITEN
ncbi:MAG: peptidylprolyl isomerase [Acidocella sp.]|nr:peptidylprolyl isomerase [Acidocella sp.]